MLDRPQYKLSFNDGTTLELGRRTCVMGIINVTPDSFSDGGSYATADDAVATAVRMQQQGAAIIDVGGESTRPGARSLSATEEADRVLPVIEGIKRTGAGRVSIDTMKAGVARQAIAAGADMVNDISALGDPEMLPLLGESSVPVVLMHMRGTPQTMQLATDYADLQRSVIDFLRERVESTIGAGVGGDKILVDPGIGFGKSASGNLVLLKRLPELSAIGQPILIGASRKSFIGAALDLPVDERLEGSLAVAAYAVAQGAHVIRTHDVAATTRAVRMIDAIHDA